MKAHLCYLLCLSPLVAGCDPRISIAANGLIPYAPVKNGYTDGPTSHVSCPLRVGCPASGVVSVTASFGTSSSIILDLTANTIEVLSGGDKPWGTPDNIPPSPLKRETTGITVEERNLLVRLANLAWAPRKAVPQPNRPTDAFVDVTLLDGKFIKQLDGYGSGRKLLNTIFTIARRHGIGR